MKSFFIFFFLASAFVLSIVSIVIASTLPGMLNVPLVIQLNARLSGLKMESENTLIQMNQTNYTNYDKSQNNCTYNITSLNQTAYQLYADLLVFNTSVNISYTTNLSSLPQTGKVNVYLTSTYLVESNVTFNFSYNGFHFDNVSEFLYFDLFTTVAEEEFTASSSNYTQIRLDGLGFHCRFCNASVGIFTVERISTAPHVAAFSQLVYNGTSVYLEDGFMYQNDILALQDDFYF